MRFHQPPPISQHAAIGDIASADPGRVCVALVSVALHDPDSAWAESTIAAAMHSPDPAVRSVAATCVGHVVRRFGALRASTVARVQELRLSPETSGAAQDALDDILTFRR